MAVLRQHPVAAPGAANHVRQLASSESVTADDVHRFSLSLHCHSTAMMKLHAGMVVRLNKSYSSKLTTVLSLTMQNAIIDVKYQLQSSCLPANTRYLQLPYLVCRNLSMLLGCRASLRTILRFWSLSAASILSCSCLRCSANVRLSNTTSLLKASKQASKLQVCITNLLASSETTHALLPIVVLQEEYS